MCGKVIVHASFINFIIDYAFSMCNMLHVLAFRSALIKKYAIRKEWAEEVALILFYCFLFFLARSIIIAYLGQ
jgi:hypothetical protein